MQLENFRITHCQGEHRYNENTSKSGKKGEKWLYCRLLFESSLTISGSKFYTKNLTKTFYFTGE